MSQNGSPHSVNKKTKKRKRTTETLPEIREMQIEDNRFFKDDATSFFKDPKKTSSHRLRSHHLRLMDRTEYEKKATPVFNIINIKPQRLRDLLLNISHNIYEQIVKFELLDASVVNDPFFIEEFALAFMKLYITCRVKRDPKILQYYFSNTQITSEEDKNRFRDNYSKILVVLTDPIIRMSDDMLKYNVDYTKTYLDNLRKKNKELEESVQNSEEPNESLIKELQDIRQLIDSEMKILQELESRIETRDHKRRKPQTLVENFEYLYGGGKSRKSRTRKSRTRKSRKSRTRKSRK
jgi:hypothetical protein